MSLDGLTINALVEEQRNNLIGARVNKILQPSKYEVIFN